MSEQTCVVLVPVKPPARGKSRLSGLEPARRAQLAEAFARDTVAAALACPDVVAVLVVTDDFRLARTLRADGCEVIPDGVTADLNATLVQAAAEASRRWPDSRPVALCADLPALRPDDLSVALATAFRDAAHGPAFVPDLAGTGTTLYSAPRVAFAPRFGPGSAAAHHALGGVRLDDVPLGVRLDVDDEDDLALAVRAGVGPRTARMTTR